MVEQDQGAEREIQRQREWDTKKCNCIIQTQSYNSMDETTLFKITELQFALPYPNYKL